MSNLTNTIVKASFSYCSLKERANFKQSNAMLLISVGQAYHEAQKFAATISLVNRSFKSCVILIADTLQRHNLCMQQPQKDTCLAKSLQLGDEWLARNKLILSQIAIPCEFVRWNTFLKHKEYSSSLNYMEKLFCQNSDIRQAILASAEEYTNRYVKRYPSGLAQRDIINNYCVQYLLEECAIMYMWRHENYHYEIYPTKRNAAMQMVHKLLIQPQRPDLLTSVNLRFNKHHANQAPLLTRDQKLHSTASPMHFPLPTTNALSGLLTRTS